MSNLVVIGQGYVGLPLSRAAVNAGISVTGVDLDEEIVYGLNNGISHVDDVSDQEVRKMTREGYRASADVSVVADADYVVICVPTPLGEDGRPDLSAVIASTKDISKYLKPQTTVVLESTTYPGTTTNLVLPLLESSGLVLDEDFWLAFSPERIDPGNKRYRLENTPKVVGGVSADSTSRAKAMYEMFVKDVVPVRGSKEAETAKLLENTYRHINIALVNEMVKFCHELDIDLWNVIDAASTKPFGFQAFYPGPGVGGHCIPIDPNYLSYEVERSLGYPFRFVELAEEINNSMPRYIVDRIQSILNDDEKAVRGSRVLLLGVTYKPNIADQRESPALPIAGLLRDRGAHVEFHDPKVMRWLVGESEVQRAEDLQVSAASADIVVLLQNHDEYDVDRLVLSSRRFFDTRGVTNPQTSCDRL